MGVMIPAEPFKQFEVVSDQYLSEHYYNKKNDEIISAGTIKKIMQEWKILDKNLPGGIYVRAYEKRMDLMRAAIVGSAGTPYHDGLFFFDIKFPEDYPNQPPMLHYFRGGLELNPAIRPNGRLCLSILNSWNGTGPGNTRWNPSQSTILQILVSLQGLVLRDKPYTIRVRDSYEPFGHYLRGTLSYNYTAFISTCKTMVSLLQKPPKNFDAFVVQHFRRRAGRILQAYTAYANGIAEPGHYINPDKDDDVYGNAEIFSLKPKSRFRVYFERKHELSLEEKLSMEQLYIKLHEVFTKIGADLTMVDKTLTWMPPSPPITPGRLSFLWNALKCCLPWCFF